MEIRHDKNGNEMLRDIYKSRVLFHARKHSGIAFKVILFCGTQWKDISISVLRMQSTHLPTHWRIQGGLQGRAPPPGVQILSFSRSFRQKCEK